MSFGKMATLLFGLAGVLAVISFTVLPGMPSFPTDGGHGHIGDGHVITAHDPSEDPAQNANRGLAEARARRAAAAAEVAAAPIDFNAPPPPGAAVSDELPAAGQGPVQQQAGAAPSQPAAPRAPQVQAAPQVTFVPGQPMIDTNPSR